MTRQEALDYIYSHGWHQKERTLKRLELLLEKLDNPQKDLVFIHLAGTNGKGSTSAMIESILREDGYKVGLFTSPYLETFEERIQINRTNIKGEDLAGWVSQIREIQENEKIDLSLFDMITAIAFLEFKDKKVDYVVLETGLGGTLDATNIIDSPLVTVITPIGLDHQGVLGNSLEEIAQSKAGIIKSGSIVVMAPQEEVAKVVLDEVARQKSVPIIEVYSKDIRINPKHDIAHRLQVFSYKDYQDVQLSLLGRYQLVNAALALNVADCLLEKGILKSRDCVFRALRKVTWHGRFEPMMENPIFYIEGAHNEMGIRGLVENLDTYFKGKDIVFILGFMEDKDYLSMIDILMTRSKEFLLYQPQVERALDSRRLKDFIIERNDSAKVSICQTLEEIDERMQTHKEKVYIGTGSLYLIGFLRTYFKYRK